MVEEPRLFVREPFVAISADLEEVIGSWCSRGTSDCFREFRYDRYNCLICLRVVKCVAKVVVDLSSVDLDVVSIETTEVSNKIVDD